MPALGMAQDEGVPLHWLEKEGETVQAGEPLMEAASDKVDVQGGCQLKGPAGADWNELSVNAHSRHFP